MRSFLLPMARLVREFSRGVHTGHAIRHGRRPHSDPGAALDRPSGDPRRQPTVETPAPVTTRCSERRFAPPPDRLGGPSSAPTAEPPPATATSPSATAERATAAAGHPAETTELAVEGSRPKPGTGSSEPQG